MKYGDVVYNQLNLSYLNNKIDSVQYSSLAWAIVGTIRGTSKEKYYHELVVESIKDTWLRWLCYLYKL